MDDLSLEAIETTKPDGGVVCASDRKAVIAFLMLSEDELDLRAQGWISADTWELWRAGMATRLSRWPFDQVWDEVRHREHDFIDGQHDAVLIDTAHQLPVTDAPVDVFPHRAEMPTVC